MISDRQATRLARLGFAARGIVYVLVGVFAIDAARTGQRPGDNQAAIASIGQLPFGRLLLAVIAIGLAGYALWRLTEAWFDPERRGSTPAGAFERAGYVVSGVVHVVLAGFAARLALRPATPVAAAPGDASAEDWTATLMAQPAGAWLVGIVALALFAVAAAQAWKAWTAGFAKDLGGETPLPDHVCTIGRIGYAARALLFALVGWFFLMAAIHADADRSGGMGQALRELQRQDGGAILLALTAAGLLLFGLYSLVEARYRRIRVRSPL